jgi:hypothetical protein
MNKVIGALVGIISVLFLIFVMMFQDTYVRSLCLDSKGKSAIDLGNYCEDSIIETVENFFLSRVFLANKNIDTIHIVIPPKAMYLLEKNRKDAVSNKILLDPTSVNGDIIIHNERIPAEIRLKGELSDHWSVMRRASLNIELDHSTPLIVAKKFSLQKPSSRQFPYDHIYHKIREDLGLIYRERKFIRVIVNGEDWGVMDFEEHFGKDFFYNHSLSESLIFKFGNHFGSYLQSRHGLNTLVGHPMHETKVYKNVKLKEYRILYSYFLHEWLVNKNYSVFDYESMALELALAEMFGSYHPLIYSNIRYYANPFTAKLEPIPSDADPFKKVENMPNYLIEAFNSHQIYPMLINNKDFLNFYHRSRELLLNIGCDELKIYFRNSTTIFKQKSDLPCELIKNNQLVKANSLHKSLNAKEGVLADYGLDYDRVVVNNQDKIVNIVHYSDGYIILKNLSMSKVRLVSVSSDNVEHEVSVELEPANDLENSLVAIKTPLVGYVDNNLSITLKIGNKYIKQKGDFTLNKDVRFNSVNLVSKVDEYQTGKYDITRTLVHSKHVKIEKGVTFRLCNACSMIFKDGVTVSGTKKQPVEFQPIHEKFGGISILNKKMGKTKIHHAKIKNSNGVESAPYMHDSSLLIYGGSYELIGVTIQDSTAEDMLHIVRSKGLVDGLVLDTGKSDGIDIDYGKLSLNNASLIDLGGDGIDTSSSEVDMKNIFIKNIYDKGLSIGEKSKVNIKDVDIQNASTCIAVKDESAATINGSKLKECRKYGLMSYIKKDKFGGAKLVYKGAINKQMSYFLDYPSSMVVNGNEYPANGSKSEIDRLYSTGFMSK